MEVALQKCFSPTGGTTELYKQTFLCLTHLDGSTVARGLSFTSTNRPLYRTQSLPKSLSIFSQSGSSCLGNKMDHLYCIATGNLFWHTVLRCTFALFFFDTAVARYKLAIFHLIPVSVWISTHIQYVNTWVDMNTCMYSHPCLSICLPKHMRALKYSEIHMGRVRLWTIQTRTNLLIKSRVIQKAYNIWSTFSHSVLHTFKATSKKNRLINQCVYTNTVNHWHPRPWWTGTKNVMSVFTAEIFNETYHQR